MTERTDGEMSYCKEHRIRERWCAKHGEWEFYCSCRGLWRSHFYLRVRWKDVEQYGVECDLCGKKI
jgi:hypothetical protein